MEAEVEQRCRLTLFAGGLEAFHQAAVRLDVDEVQHCGDPAERGRLRRRGERLGVDRMHVGIDRSGEDVTTAGVDDRCPAVASPSPTAAIRSPRTPTSALNRPIDETTVPPLITRSNRASFGLVDIVDLRVCWLRLACHMSWSFTLREQANIPKRCYSADCELIGKSSRGQSSGSISCM